MNNAPPFSEVNLNEIKTGNESEQKQGQEQVQEQKQGQGQRVWQGNSNSNMMAVPQAFLLSLMQAFLPTPAHVPPPPTLAPSLTLAPAPTPAPVLIPSLMQSLSEANGLHQLGALNNSLQPNQSEIEEKKEIKELKITNTTNITEMKETKAGQDEKERKETKEIKSQRREPTQEELETLQHLGYETSHVRAALLAANFNLDNAANLLLSNVSEYQLLTMVNAHSTTPATLSFDTFMRIMTGRSFPTQPLAPLPETEVPYNDNNDNYNDIEDHGDELEILMAPIPNNNNDDDNNNNNNNNNINHETPNPIPSLLSAPSVPVPAAVPLVAPLATEVKAAGATSHNVHEPPLELLALLHLLSQSRSQREAIPVLTPEDEVAISELMQLGFTREQCISAYLRAGRSQINAANSLFNLNP